MSKKSAASWRIEQAAKLRESGLCKAEFARRHGIPMWKIYRELKGSVGANEGGFVAVKMAGRAAPQPKQDNSRVRLIVGGDLAIEAETSADPTWIARLVNAVKGGRL